MVLGGGLDSGVGFGVGFFNSSYEIRRKPRVMADAVEALGQHVHQEAPDKLVRVKPDRLPTARAVDVIVLPTERDAGVVGCNEMATRCV